MNKSMLKIFTRTFKKKMAAGATFDEVAAEYPRLTQEELKEIADALEK